MSDGQGSFRYPVRFELFRLEPLGNPPYFGASAARERYEAGKATFVLPEGEPPAWYLHASPRGHRFTVTYYASTKTPLREVTWEREDGELFCRRCIDLFYPEGDPHGRVRYADLFSVTQYVSTDGIVAVSLESPAGDRFQEVAGVELDRFRVAVPIFGEWDELIAAGAPADRSRFGQDAIDAAMACADEVIAQGVVDDRAELVAAEDGWRVPATPKDILGAIDATLAGEPTSAHVPVIERGQTLLLPLMIQAAPSRGLTSSEEERRMRILADALRDALEYREGQAIQLDLDLPGAEFVASYVTALRRVGATEAYHWAYQGKHDVVLVWTGDASQGTRALALHVVPTSWESGRGGEAAAAGIDVAWSFADVAAHRKSG